MLAKYYRFSYRNNFKFQKVFFSLSSKTYAGQKRQLKNIIIAQLEEQGQEEIKVIFPTMYSVNVLIKNKLFCSYYDASVYTFTTVTEEINRQLRNKYKNEEIVLYSYDNEEFIRNIREETKYICSVNKKRILSYKELRHMFLTNGEGVKKYIKMQYKNLINHAQLDELYTTFINAHLNETGMLDLNARFIMDKIRLKYIDIFSENLDVDFIEYLPDRFLKIGKVNTRKIEGKKRYYFVSDIHTDFPIFPLFKYADFKYENYIAKSRYTKRIKRKVIFLSENDIFRKELFEQGNNELLIECFNCVKDVLGNMVFNLFEISKEDIKGKGCGEEAFKDKFLKALFEYAILEKEIDRDWKRLISSRIQIDSLTNLIYYLKFMIMNKLNFKAYRIKYDELIVSCSNRIYTNES